MSRVELDEKGNITKVFLNEKLMVDNTSCKHLHKKIIPMGCFSTVVCADCNQELDEFKGGVFEN